MRGKSLPRLETREIRQVHHLATCRPERGDGALGAKEDRAEIQGMNGVPSLRGGLLEGEPMHDGRRVDQHVEAAKLFSYALGKRSSGVGVGEVGAEAVGVSASTED